MRLAFFLLVLLNLAFHVWSAGYLGRAESGREPERLTQQIAPEKIRIVAPDAVKAATADPEPPKAADKEPAAEAVKVCHLVSGLGGEAAVALETALAAKEGVTVAAVKSTGAAIAHWVLIPRLANRVAGEGKAAEVQRLGIKDFSVVADETSGPYVVSLGVFSTDKAAQDHLAELRLKGVRSAVVENRERPGQKRTLEIRGTAESLRGLPDLLSPEAGATLADCPAAAT